MNFLYKLINFVYSYTQKLGICGNTGLIVGLTSGLMLSFLNIKMGPNLVLTNDEVWKVALLLGLFCWLLILFLLLVFMRLRLSEILAPSLFNSLLVCFLTVFLVNKLSLYPIAWLIGMIVGIIVGFLLCQISKSLNLKR
jgi:hypothetical protein